LKRNSGDSRLQRPSTGEKTTSEKGGGRKRGTVHRCLASTFQHQGEEYLKSSGETRILETSLKEKKGRSKGKREKELGRSIVKSLELAG